ncbi:MAG TPA: efflux transporter outer membrane subunit [Acidobacteriaceae bacterium]|nr:efflux transporter outer membrane subunit [Acidobacteriaceae bacterium]
MNHTFRSLSSLALILTIAGCKVGPNYKRPTVNTPASYRGALAPDIAPATSATPLGAQKWNTVFTDPVLQQLIAEALKNNYDVKIAADRVLEQQAQVGITKAAQYPTLTGGATYDALGLPSSLFSSLNNNSSNSKSTGQNNYYAGALTASVAWNLDFWGYYRRQTEAARANLRATEWAKQTTYSTLIENVATSYYQIRTLDAELAITRSTLDARKQSLDLTRKLEQGGADSLADVRQAEELYYAAQAQIPDLERQIEQQENNLRLLLGADPGPVVRNIDDSPSILASAPHPADIPVGLPSDLLERRPDVRRAEELLIQANANIGVARAQYFPQLALTGTGGTTGSQLKGLVNPVNVYYYAAGNLTQPIFDAGKIRANYRLAQDTDKELLDTYQQTIAGALRDVSNALIAYNKTREFREQQEKQTAASADAVRLARIRYSSGSTSYLEVLTTDTNLYSSQLTLEAAQQAEALSLVQLYNALGGGW